MEYLVNSLEAKAIDSYSIGTTGIPSLVLMERASLAVSAAVQDLAALMAGKKTCICAVCGNGNNGGDGLAAARILHSYGYENTCIFLAGNREKLSPDAEVQLKIAENSHVPVLEAVPDRSDMIIIDAIFGIGLTRDVAGAFADVIGIINRLHGKGAKVIAVDIPSGIHSDNGKIMGCCVNADVSVTFGFRKAGMILYPGHEHCGRIICADIGFSEDAVYNASPKAYIYDDSDLKRLPARRPDSNKGTYGKVLIIAGSRNMAGAAILSAKAAYVCGAGLVTVYTDECNRVILQQSVPEAVLRTYTEDNDFSDIKSILNSQTAVVIGPGLGTGEASRRLVRAVLENVCVPTVIDADALNIISEDDKAKKELATMKGPAIITPHIKELSRLTGYNIQYLLDTTIKVCRDFSHENSVICIAKNARTIITDKSEKVYINVSGNDGMSTGGSGDVLTGVIASFMAQGMEPYDAAVLGVYIHGRAGDVSAEKLGKRSLLASDIISGLPYILKA